MLKPVYYISYYVCALTFPAFFPCRSGICKCSYDFIWASWWTVSWMQKYFCYICFQLYEFPYLLLAKLIPVKNVPLHWGLIWHTSISMCLHPIFGIKWIMRNYGIIIFIKKWFHKNSRCAEFRFNEGTGTSYCLLKFAALISHNIHVTFAILWIIWLAIQIFR